MDTKLKSNNVESYIAAFPENVQRLLQALRQTIKTAAPEAEETISYNMPTYKQNGNLVYFAGCKNHIGFYPTPGAILAFKNELADFKTAKGSVQFPLDKPLPLKLVTNMVLFRVAKNKQKPTKK